MMLTIKNFLIGMTYLRSFYTNFKFDPDDNLMIQVWYNAFKKISILDFQYLINQYCAKNTYPPCNPTQILGYLTETDWLISYERELFEENNPPFQLENSSKKLL